jgi:hypothetical protein
LNEGAELDLKPDFPQDVLKSRLLFVAFAGGIGDGFCELPAQAGLLPKFIVVEVAIVFLLYGIVDILDVNENCHFVHAKAPTHDQKYACRKK